MSQRLISKLKTLLEEGGSKERVTSYENIIIDQIEEYVKKDDFYSLPTNEILKIIGKIDNEDIEVLFELISKMGENKGEEPILLLNVIKREEATLEECIKILSKFKQSPLLQLTSELFSENESFPEPDYIHEIETLKKEIEKLQNKTEEEKEEKKTYFPPVTEKPSDFESNICKAASEGKLTSVQYLVEQCHANVETKDENERTPIRCASLNGHLEVIKYLYETCHAKIDDRAIIWARTEEIKKYLQSKKEMF